MAQGDGSHYFSIDGSDHEQAKARWKARVDSMRTVGDDGFPLSPPGCLDSLRARCLMDPTAGLET